MAWTKENGPDGLPVWHGADSILNPFYEDLGTNNGGGLALIGLGLLLVLLGGISAVLAIMGICFALLGACFIRPRGQKFGGARWKLAAKSAQLSFNGGSNWAVPLDAVARVETGRTAEYSPSRDYTGLVQTNLVNSSHHAPVSSHEWQTFLFMADGTRRVIYHANAARDDCAALAASIRSWLETACAAGPAPASPSQPSPARPVADGFDL